MKFFWIFIYIVFILLFILWLLWLAFSIESFFGFIFVSFFLFLFLFPLCIFFRPKWFRIYIFILCWFLPFIFVGWFEKNTKTDENFSLECIWECKKYSWNIFNLVTEDELIQAVFKIHTIIGLDIWWIDDKNSSFYSINGQKINIPSQLPGWLLNSTNNNQYYLQYWKDYIPWNPTILFLHGSAGNFLFYQKYFSDLIQESQYLLISPSYWFWNWDVWNFEQFIVDIYWDLEDKKIILHSWEKIIMWLSNGGKWLTRILWNNEIQFEKYIYLSWFFEKDIITDWGFQEIIDNKNISIIHGWIDKNTPFFDDINIVFWSSNIYFFPTADHFLLITHYQEIIDILKNILKTDEV